MNDTSFPVATSLNFRFSPYEDRLILTPQLKQGGFLQILFTRRMLLVTLQQCLKHLPDLAGLNQTPSDYWQEVLQLNHQSAMQQSQAQAADETNSSDSDAGSASDLPPQLYLATEILTQPSLEQKQLTLCFKGLKLPEAMSQPQPHQPLVALTLTVDNLYQLIHQLVTQAQNAQWHLPLELPWLNTPAEGQNRYTTQ